MNQDLQGFLTFFNAAAIFLFIIGAIWRSLSEAADSARWVAKQSEREKEWAADEEKSKALRLAAFKKLGLTEEEGEELF